MVLSRVLGAVDPGHDRVGGRVGRLVEMAGANTAIAIRCPGVQIDPPVAAGEMSPTRGNGRPSPHRRSTTRTEKGAIRGKQPADPGLRYPDAPAAARPLHRCGNAGHRGMVPPSASPSPPGGEPDRPPPSSRPSPHSTAGRFAAPTLGWSAAGRSSRTNCGGARSGHGDAGSGRGGAGLTPTPPGGRRH